MVIPIYMGLTLVARISCALDGVGGPGHARRGPGNNQDVMTKGPVVAPATAWQYTQPGAGCPCCTDELFLSPSNIMRPPCYR